MKVVIGALELDPPKVAGSAKSVPAEHGPQTDRGRLEKLRRWDQRTWTQFFKDYESKIITLCVAMTRDRTIAEDICADTFVRVVSSIDAFRENSSIKTWIYTIARNLCLTHLGCLMLSTEAPVGEGIESSESGGVSVLTEGAGSVAA